MSSNYNTWFLLAQILAAGAILAFLYFRRSPVLTSREREIQRIEIKLLGNFSPTEVRFQPDRTAQLVIHRFDSEPKDEIFEIEELNIYELLPAGHTTIISFETEKRGMFPITLGEKQQAGMLIVE